MLEDTRVPEKAAVEEAFCLDAETCRQEDLEGPLATTPGDLQVVISWLGLRLEELERRADYREDAHRDTHCALARETLERYVPLADRMGMQVLRKRLEDASFRILDPPLYAELVRKLAPIQAEDEMCLVLLQAGIERFLEENGIAGTVQGRIKGLYSLYRKMRHLNCPLESILDRIGLRVIVPSVGDCYQVLALLQARFRLVPGTLDDYIAHPKANGYRSLHACFYPVPDLLYKPVEIQIRTTQMDQEAQSGPAAHWQYKHDEEARPEGEVRPKWFRGLLEQREPEPDPVAFIQRLYCQVFDDRLAVVHA